MTGLDDQVAELEREAVKTLANIKYAQRSFVLEFAGTPKSGKSTAVEAVRHFFSRQGFRVHVLAERAALCPIPMKGHLFFNTWCAASMLAELLENVDTDTDIIIVDRGIFDALVWLTLQAQRGELTSNEREVIEKFLLMDRWKSLIDLAIVMRVEAQKAMEREVAQRITSKPGSVMNPAVLERIASAVKDAISSYGKSFNRLIDQDTTDSQSVRQSNIELARKILNALENFANPEILVVPRAELRSFR